MVERQKEQLLSLIYQEAEDNLDFQAELTVSLEVEAIMYESDYEDDEDEEYERSYYDLDYYAEQLTEHNIDEVLNRIVKEMMTGIKNVQNRYDIIGINIFYFKIIIVENL